MRLQGRELSPTRAQALALRDEQKLIREGYEFLDEKRMLLAQELLRQLESYRVLKARHESARRAALESLARATQRHGLEELILYPQPYVSAPRVTIETRNFLGIKLVEAAVDAQGGEAGDDAPRAAFPSAEAKRAADAFRALLAEGSRLAAVTSNLQLLAREYRATERRARALENVMLPEIAVALKQIGEHLETAEQEEALLVRHVKRNAGDAA